MSPHTRAEWDKKQPEDGAVASDSEQRPGSQAALHLANRDRVVALLRDEGALSQIEIAKSTGLAAATVSNIVRELASAGSVTVQRGSDARRRMVRLPREAGLVAAVDFGHRHVTVAVADLSHEVLAEQRSDLGPGLLADDALKVARRLLDASLQDAGAEATLIRSIGMGLPAPIDDVTGAVGALSILPGWVGVNAAEAATERLGAPVWVENDANLGALAEHTWGAGQGVKDLAFVKLSEGVGAGLVIGGKLFRGRRGTAGEIGHTTMDDMGAVCRCGNRGCLETIVAARSVVELLERRMGTGQTIADVVALAETGDTACVRVLEDTGRLAGLALANLCNLFNPERILIGGELAQAGELLLAPMRESVRRCGIPSATVGLDIVLAELGRRGPLLGAVALALEQVKASEIA